MGLLQDIEHAVMSSDRPLTDVLRMAKILAAKLDNDCSESSRGQDRQRPAAAEASRRRAPAGGSGKGVAALAGGAGKPHHCTMAASPGDASAARRLAGVACQHEEKGDGDKPSRDL